MITTNRGREKQAEVNSLTLQESTYKALKQHLYPGDALEATAIMLCHIGKGKNGSRLMVKEVIQIPACKYKKQTSDYLSWPFGEYMTAENISRIDKNGLSIFTIHSHPGGYDKFSLTDNKNDKKLFHSVCGWFDDARPNGSSIMLPDGGIKARTCDCNGKFSPIGSVSVVGENIKIWKQVKKKGRSADYTLRISQTFGKGTLNLLRQLKVAVVGCSGTGSIVVELLARNCIGSLLLIDPDIVEEKNLNRIVNTKKTDAKKGMAKVEVLKKAIKGMGMNTDVEIYKSDTYNKEVIEALADCDVLFGCVDSAAGKYHLECVANAYLIPYFDVGVYLEANQEGKIHQADAVSNYVHPENMGLLDRKVYTSKQVTSERWRRDDKKYYEKQKKYGYLEGVDEDQPAVISVNMQAACMAFNDFLARIHNFRLDDNSEFEVQIFQLVQGCYLNNKTSKKNPSSVFEKHLGMGERSLLIQNLKNE